MIAIAGPPPRPNEGVITRNAHSRVVPKGECWWPENQKGEDSHSFNNFCQA